MNRLYVKTIQTGREGRSNYGEALTRQNFSTPLNSHIYPDKGYCQ